MALTINTTPANISNSGAWNVTTSLVEDGSHVNLRVRADIKVSGVTKATAEKPKGLADFDFWEILKTLVPGLSFARNAGALYNVAGGSPLIAYTVTFSEVYEVAGTTTVTGATTSGTKRFVPAKGDQALPFTNYVGVDSTSRFANMTLRNNACKFYTYNPSELWLVFFTEKTSLELFYSKDGGAYDHATHIAITEGWVVIVININQMMAGVTNNLRIQMGELAAAKISEVLTIYIDTSEKPDRTVLEFDGILGGKEYLEFGGQRINEFKTFRNYMTSAKKAKKPLSFTGINQQLLSTVYRDIYNTEYLKHLLTSENVDRLEPAYATPTDVTVITESARTAGPDLFTNTIEIEYEN